MAAHGNSPLPGALDHLRTILGHHTWATLKLLDHCLELPPGQLELSTPGTFGSIHTTLHHIVGSDHRYLRGITGEPAGPRPRDPLPVATLRADMARQARRWHELLDRIDELDAVMPAIPGEYPEIEHAVGLFLAQAVYHGQEHRAHVCSVLGAHGLEVPDLSGWAYFTS